MCDDVWQTVYEYSTVDMSLYLLLNFPTVEAYQGRIHEYGLE